MGPFQPGLPYDSMVPAGPVSSPFISSHLNLRPRALPLWKGRLRSLTDHTEHCRLTQEIAIWLRAGKQHPTARRSGIKDTGKEQKQLRFASSHYPLLASHFNAENPRFYSPRAVPGAPLLPRGCSRGVNRGPAAGRSLERSSETQHGAHCPRPSGPHLRAAGRRSAAFGLNGRAPRVAPHGPAVSTATARCQDGGGAGSACVGGGGWGSGQDGGAGRGGARGGQRRAGGLDGGGGCAHVAPPPSLPRAAGAAGAHGPAPAAAPATWACTWRPSPPATVSRAPRSLSLYPPTLPFSLSGAALGAAPLTVRVSPQGGRSPNAARRAWCITRVSAGPCGAGPGRAGTGRRGGICPNGAVRPAGPRDGGRRAGPWPPPRRNRGSVWGQRLPGSGWGSRGLALGLNPPLLPVSDPQGTAARGAGLREPLWGEGGPSPRPTAVPPLGGRPGCCCCCCWRCGAAGFPTLQPSSASAVPRAARLRTQPGG